MIVHVFLWSIANTIIYTIIPYYVVVCLFVCFCFLFFVLGEGGGEVGLHVDEL